MNTAPLHYDRRGIALHWLTAALVILLWTMGQTIDWFPRGTGRSFYRSLHIALGAVLAVTLVLRLQWRLSGGGQLPPAGSGWLRVVSTGTHHALYLLLLAAVLVGLLNTWVRGDTLFGLWQIPSPAPDNRALRHTVGEWHEWAANALIFVAAVHAGAALWHHHVLRDGVLQRMLPSLRR